MSINEIHFHVLLISIINDAIVIYVYFEPPLFIV